MENEYLHRKVEREGYTTTVHIKANKGKNRIRTFRVGIEGTCCWKIYHRQGDSQELTPGEDKTPEIAYISKITSFKC